MTENKIGKTILKIITVILIAVLSICVISPKVSSSEFNEKNIQTLESKKEKVMELTAGITATSIAVAMLPGDSSTPLANQIMQLTSYLLIVIGAILLEKILLTLTGYVTFTWLIPMGMALLAIYIFSKKAFFRDFAIKIILFGIAIFCIVPFSIKISEKIETTYKDTLDQTIAEAKDLESETNEATESTETTEENNEENKSWWSNVTTKVQETVSNVSSGATKLIEKGEKELSKLIDAVAIFLITSCIIPIVVLLCFVWFVKIILGVNIPVPSKNQIENLGFKFKNKESKPIVEQAEVINQIEDKTEIK